MKELVTAKLKKMSKIRTFLSAIGITFLLSGSAYSQSGVSIYAGPSFPLFDFRDDGNEYSGAAAVGLNFGGKYVYQFNENGLGIYFATELNYNGMRNEDNWKQEWEDNFQADIKFQKYINIPLTTGLNYTYKFNDKISFFGDLGIGADFLKVTNTTYEQESEEIVRFTNKLSTELAYKIGGGVMLNNTFIIALHYDGLGSHDVNQEVLINGIPLEDTTDPEYKVSLLTLTFGVRF